MRRRSFFSSFVVLAVVMGATIVGLAPGAHSADATGTFLVVFKGNAVPKDASSVIQKAGGTLVYSYDQIGVAIASTDKSGFRANLLKDNRIDGASATGGFATKLSNEQSGDDNAPIDIPASDNDNLSPLQWDMRQIHSPEAHAITGGSPSVVVGDIDTGLDFTHPDLAANVDFANSVSCIGGVPDQNPAAWNDDNGHGTHTAGTIAAASNGIGIVGVAPNVKIAGIKAGNAAGYFFPEAVVCSFVWAATHNIAVTNNSYFADPWLFNCKNDPDQRAIWVAERRAIRFAIQNGTSVVAAEGNQADDLAHPTMDITSPDFPPGSEVPREVRNNCAVVPVEVPGVIGVTAQGNLRFKSFYSSYGVGTVQVIAPGGDSILQRTPEAPNGRVLSTWPLALAANCLRQVSDGGALYCYLQGTSMASPHVAGVAALIVSQGVNSPGAVTAKINNTADPMDCPADMSMYDFFPAVDNGAPQQCQGGIGYNGFNGHGQVNALSAVS